MPTLSQLREPIDVAVLNTIQALAADLDLSAGIMTCTGLGKPLVVRDRIEVVKTAYAAGTAGAKRLDFGAVTLAANTLYKMSVRFPNAVVPGGPDADPLLRIRSYSFWSGSSAPTGAQVATALVALINADPKARGTAAVTSTDGVTFTQSDVNDGEFFFDNYNSGAVESVTTAYVAPSGTNDIVNALAPGQGTQDDYITYRITWNRLYNNNAIGGLKAYKEVDTYIFVSTGATNRAAFVTELDAILAGTHSPSTDYL